MDRGRAQQVQRLKDRGWYEDRETLALAEAAYLGDDSVINGPSYLKDPKGRVFAVTSGYTTALDGLFKAWVSDTHQAKTVIYADGQKVG